MAGSNVAIELIKRYEAFNEKAFADPDTGDYPYTIGFGTQYYPNGEAVKQGHLCTYQKALEYLLHEISELRHDILDLNLGLDECMLDALISFAHSIGWDAFLYSQVIDLCEHEDWIAVSQEIRRWVFDSDTRIIGSLVARRREEAQLFLQNVDNCPWTSSEVLLRAFRNYTASKAQVRAIRLLEEQINPYILAEFCNNFAIDQGSVFDIPEEELGLIFDL